MYEPDRNAYLITKAKEVVLNFGPRFYREYGEPEISGREVYEIKGNDIVIKASSLEMGKVEEKMTVENQTNNNLKISFSAKYMLEALKMFDAEEIHILLNGEVNPIILKEIDNENIIQLILPMKTY